MILGSGMNKGSGEGVEVGETGYKGPLPGEPPPPKPDPVGVEPLSGSPLGPQSSLLLSFAMIFLLCYLYIVSQRKINTGYFRFDRYIDDIARNTCHVSIIQWSSGFGRETEEGFEQDSGDRG